MDPGNGSGVRENKTLHGYTSQTPQSDDSLITVFETKHHSLSKRKPDRKMNMANYAK